MSDSNHPSESGTQFSAVRLLIVIIAVLALALIIYQVFLNSTQPVAGNTTMLKVVGLDKPITNRLDERFTDANGDLVADPPSDPTKQVDPETLYFSFIATPDPSTYQEVWAGFVDHLAKTTGKNVEYVLFESREDQLAALRNGELHVTGFNTGNVPIAVNASGFIPMATPGRGDRSAAYKMQIIVPSRSPIQNVNDLRGRTLALTTPGSNSGYKAPIVILMHDFSLQPGDYNMVNTFGHEASIEGIAAGRYDAAAVASDMLARAIGRGDISVSDVRVIYESEPFPTAGLGYAYDLKPELAEKVREAFFSYDWSGTALEAEYASSGADQFVPVSYKDNFALIRRIDDAVGFEHAPD